MYNGNSRQWKCEYEVVTADSAEEFIRQINTYLAIEEGWKKTGSSHTRNAARSRWRFKVKNNQRWRGEVTVRKKEGENEGLLIAFEIVRIV